VDGGGDGEGGEGEFVVCFLGCGGAGWRHGDVMG
jgi:hypothetical protein